MPAVFMNMKLKLQVIQKGLGMSQNIKQNSASVYTFAVLALIRKKARYKI